MTLRKRNQTWQSIAYSQPEYIRFYNSLWLVANDVIIGIALGSYIIENASFVAAQVDHILTVWSIEGLRTGITWLTDWPGGLKLNTELAAFLGDLFIWVIDYWSGKLIVTHMMLLISNVLRMYDHAAACLARYYPLHRLFCLCWSYNAHFPLL